jgi:hypothetical protein
MAWKRIFQKYTFLGQRRLSIWKRFRLRILESRLYCAILSSPLVD